MTGSTLPIECAKCHTALIRISQSESNDRVICPICWAVGDYRDIVEQRANLVTGIIIEREIRELVNHIRFHRK